VGKSSGKTGVRKNEDLIEYPLLRDAMGLEGIRFVQVRHDDDKLNDRVTGGPVTSR
jgi:hypothetical protein